MISGIIEHMKTATATKTPHGKNIMHFAIATGLILLVPLVAMQFSDEVDWKLGDFVFMGCLLFGTGLLYELLSSMTRNTTYKILIGAVLLLALLAAWVELAAGIFD